jgi:hypothetical protein
MPQKDDENEEQPAGRQESALKRGHRRILSRRSACGRPNSHARATKSARAAQRLGTRRARSGDYRSIAKLKHDVHRGKQTMLPGRADSVLGLRVSEAAARRAVYLAPGFASRMTVCAAYRRFLVPRRCSLAARRCSLTARRCSLTARRCSLTARRPSLTAYRCPLTAGEGSLTWIRHAPRADARRPVPRKRRIVRNRGVLTRRDGLLDFREGLLARGACPSAAGACLIHVRECLIHVSMPDPA